MATRRSASVERWVWHTRSEAFKRRLGSGSRQIISAKNDFVLVLKVYNVIVPEY